MSDSSQYQLLTQRRFLPYFIVQCLGAFNDNLYRQAIVVLLLFLGIQSDERTLYTNIAPAIFILPYLLFSGFAGQLAEKYEKTTLVRYVTALEIVVMGVAAVGFFLHHINLLLVALFLTGFLSTLFGPVKYSALPSVLKPQELTGGNGLVEMGTNLSIIGGMMLAGLIFSYAGENGAQAAGVLVVIFAVIRFLASLVVPKMGANSPDLKINFNIPRDTLSAWKLTHKQLAVRNAVLGTSWFWFIGVVLSAQLPTYVDDYLGGDHTVLMLLLSIFSISTGLGSLICERLSGRVVELGLVPLGALGILVFFIDLALASPGLTAQANIGMREFIHQEGMGRIMLDFAGIGFFTGVYVVPLFALIQSRTPKEEMARVFAGVNIENSVFIVAASGLGILTLSVLHLTVPQLFLVVAILHALVSLRIFMIVPEFFMRFIVWMGLSVLYRFRRVDLERNIPETGPAVLVCNHVSFVDALLIAGSIQRPVRFVMHYKIFNVPIMSWIFKTAKAIPIATAKEDPEVLRLALEEIDKELAAGELVCIFPEGALTLDGDIAPFKSGIETILEKRPVPVVPLALRNMWASMWSKRDHRFGRMRLPRRLRAPVELVSGPVVNNASAAELELIVRDLRGDYA